ncbi:tyrosine--tRNA ligase MSY1 [Sporobolomyces salmoneus]|uniref:tyrosine--tRNA ligase MSY1 n=1 Tax=Sporobolomyces salmoneus TaxID=183962 RepID=UPI0031810288
MLRKNLRSSLLPLSKPSATPTAIHRFFSSSSLRQNVLNELESRGMLQDLTSRAARQHVEKPTTVYLGVDPSANSLHLGNLLALIGLLHFRLQGHNAIALIGGATGSIGDPSGRSTERNALSPETLEANVAGITRQLTTFLDRGVAFAQSRTRRRDNEATTTATGEGKETVEGTIRVENNMKWIGGMSLLDFLSKVGKMARVSTMLSRESVKSRLDSSSGISFTEFSYQLLQAYDFLTLHRLHNCTIQLGGSDQLGNIASGIDMIRRSKFGNDVEEEEGGKGGGDDPAFGVTFPLLTTASGEKFGKSAGNAVWLDPKMTSPFDVYQFFLRTTDEEVEKYLKIFTFIRVVEIKGIMEDHKAQPSARIAQKVLAAEATELIHGSEGLQQALAATKLFYTPSSSLASLIDESFLLALDGSSSTSTIPSILVRLPKSDILGDKLEKIAIESGLFGSKTQARKAIEAGTLQINGVKIKAKDHQRKIEEGDLLQGKLVVLKAGKSGNKAVLLE